MTGKTGQEHGSTSDHMWFAENSRVLPICSCINAYLQCTFKLQAQERKEAWRRSGTR
jgi:hypothetical protein